ncbi:MAG: hypothetical protein COA52_10320 [Hyphomicrobiales bacterium]|nr:MAG: hypothetical protein COA52_10320 [Hyphomicrobiales bacterium]
MDVTASLAGAPQPPPQSEPRARAPEREAVSPIETQQSGAKSVQADTAAQNVDVRQTDQRVERQQQAQTNQQEGSGAKNFIEPPELDRSFELDEGSSTFVFKATDQDDGHVVRQVPEEILLKLRAYNEGKPPGGRSMSEEIQSLFERTA